MSMPALPPINVPALLKQYDLRPSKGLGQNFLQDEKALRGIVAAADLASTDTVLEIGSGVGSLTRHLAQACRTVTAVELDQHLFPILQQVLAPFPNVSLVQGDILRLKTRTIIGEEDFVVVANLPYYITSAIIRHLLEGSPRPRRLVLTVQSEVAARICARAGKLNLLALSVQVYGHPDIVLGIPAASFFPSPKVDSAVVKLEIYPRPVIAENQLDVFFHLIKAGFSQKRKTLRNALSAGLRLTPKEAENMLLKAEIDPARRAETLSLEEWGKLVAADLLRESASPNPLR